MDKQINKQTNKHTLVPASINTVDCQGTGGVNCGGQYESVGSILGAARLDFSALRASILGAARLDFSALRASILGTARLDFSALRASNLGATRLAFSALRAVAHSGPLIGSS